MEESQIVPFLRLNLDILFVGLNPANGSSQNGHYFSVNQAFWNQLLQSGLITTSVDKRNADELIFGSNQFNYKKWSFGITDLITSIAESNSNLIKPSNKDCINLQDTIIRMKPKIAIFLHSKVVDTFLKYLHKENNSVKTGHLGKLINESNTVFFTVPFPHGNSITSAEKIKHYSTIKDFIQKMTLELNSNQKNV